MRRLLLPLTAALITMLPAPALAGAGNFTIVNATGRDISALSIRRFGAGGWQPLAAAPRAGGRGAVEFSDEDCAFDLRATLAGGATAVWSGVNLCEAQAVTLNRSDSGALWVDYD
ncbi:MAG TPA: hypothetical protein VMN38_12340 [Sphingomicrobium sp.]|nr:hypothetical protein [Sphingomicrobium sp.]